MVEGTQRCTSEDSDVRAGGMVKAKEMHVIDRGTVYEECVRHLATVLISEGQSNSRWCQEIRKAFKGKRRKGKASIVKEK